MPLKAIGDARYTLYGLRDTSERPKTIKVWLEKGGLMIASYSIINSILNADNGDDASLYHQAFMDPGPDLLVCDEAAALKNQNTDLFKILDSIRTPCRVLITGTPLQNNLLELHALLKFIHSRILGSKSDFQRLFESPILGGEAADATESEVALMRARSFVLNKLLEGN